jgi:hypothetical protein
MTCHLLALLLIAPALLLATPVSAAEPASTWTLVAGNLDRPRGVEIFQGQVAVAEAGRGGRACGSVAGVLMCAGLSSQITLLDITTGARAPLVTGLLSVVVSSGQGSPLDVVGVNGLSARGDRLLGIMGQFPEAFESFTCPLPGDFVCAADLDAARRYAGNLVSVTGSGSWDSLASVGSDDYEFTLQFPESYQKHESNPYGLLAVKGGAFIADAGSNTLTFVTKSGDASVLHHFYLPSTGFPSAATPTCVAKTDDALWVADLSGHLFRIEGDSATLVPNAYTKHVTGCVAGEDNDIYLVNMWTTPGLPTPFTGNVVRYKTDEGTWSVVGTPLNAPNMITLGPDGNLYVSADSMCTSRRFPPVCLDGGTVRKMATPFNDIDQASGRKPWRPHP